jgi:hypothetical protein
VGAAIIADSSAYTFTTIPTKTVPADDEFTVTIIRENAGTTTFWGSGVQRYIPIETPTGGQLRLPNFSVRERVIGATNSAASNSLTTAQAVTIYGYVTVLR